MNTLLPMLLFQNITIIEMKSITYDGFGLGMKLANALMFSFV